MSWLSHPKSATKAVSKAVSTAVSAASGFAAGGNAGFIGGLARGVYENSKTGKAEAVTLGNVGKSAATGFATAAVSATALAAGHAVLAAGAGGAGSATGFVGKAVAWGKGGGLLPGIGSLAKGVISAIPSAGKYLSGGAKGLTTAADSQGVQNLSNDIAQAYNKNLKAGVTQATKDLSNLPTEIRSKGLGNAARDRFSSIFQPPPTPNDAPVVVTSGSTPDTTMILVAVAVAVAVFFFVKKGH